MSEKKELKEKDIKNVSGGGKNRSYCYNSLAYCSDCKKYVDCYIDSNNVKRCSVCNGTRITFDGNSPEENINGSNARPNH